MERETDRQSKRERHGETYRERDRQTEKYRVPASRSSRSLRPFLSIANHPISKEHQMRINYNPIHPSISGETQTERDRQRETETDRQESMSPIHPSIPQERKREQRRTLFVDDGAEVEKVSVPRPVFPRVAPDGDRHVPVAWFDQ